MKLSKNKSAKSEDVSQYSTLDEHSTELIIDDFRRKIKACSNALDFVYHTKFDLSTLQSRVRMRWNTLYSAHYTRFDKSNRVQRCLKLVKLLLNNHSTFPLFAITEAILHKVELV